MSPEHQVDASTPLRTLLSGFFYPFGPALKITKDHLRVEISRSQLCIWLPQSSTQTNPSLIKLLGDFLVAPGRPG